VTHDEKLKLEGLSSGGFEAHHRRVVVGQVGEHAVGKAGDGVGAGGGGHAHEAAQIEGHDLAEWRDATACREAQDELQRRAHEGAQIGQPAAAAPQQACSRHQTYIDGRTLTGGLQMYLHVGCYYIF
jgi:hypothetical protein